MNEERPLARFAGVTRAREDLSPAARSRGSLGGKESEVKLIVAYIRPERLNHVKQSLYENAIFKLSITNALGCGQQGGFVEHYRGAEQEVNLHKKVRLEVAVNDEYVKPTVDAIIAGARTEEVGDGKIMVIDLVDVIRVRTGETGPEAIG